MVKKIFIYSALVIGLFDFVSAQSGRRIQTDAQPTSTPQVQLTQDVTEPIEEVGYSESSANAPRAISARRPATPKTDSKKQPTTTAAPSSAQTTAATAVAVGGVDEEETVKVETSLITMPVSIYDRNGLYIPNLRQSDFKIFEDGVEQQIAYFGTTDKPFTVILLLDTSPSTEYKIEEIQQAATAFIDQLKPQDNVMVIEFDQNIHVLTEATNDRRKIYKAIKRADFGGGTSLYDAVDFSLKKRLGKIEGRKAIVLFTDGVDTTSFKSDFDATISDAEESDAMIFPIYYNTYLANNGIGQGDVMSTPPVLGIPSSGGANNRGTSSAEYSRGRAYLNRLATATGGRVFRPEATPGGLTAAFEGIAEELRRQYNIGYYPTDEGTIGQRKQIRVRVNRPRLVIRTRDSYIVGGKQTGESK